MTVGRCKVAQNDRNSKLRPFLVLLIPKVSVTKVVRQACFILLKLKVTKIPIQNRAKIGPNRKIFSFPAIAVYVVKAVLDARGPI